MLKPVEILQQGLFDSVARPWQDVLPASQLGAILSEEGLQYRRRLYTPIVTLWAMVYQVLCPDKSLRNTVKWLRKWLVVEGEFPSSDTGAYSNCLLYTSPSPRDRG